MARFYRIKTIGPVKEGMQIHEQYDSLEKVEMRLVTLHKEAKIEYPHDWHRATVSIVKINGVELYQVTRHYSNARKPMYWGV